MLAHLFGLNSIYFETIEKQYKYYTNLSRHGLCLLAVWPGKVGRGGRRWRDRVQKDTAKGDQSKRFDKVIK